MIDQLQKNLSPTVNVELIEQQLSTNDLNDLCDSTDAAIEGGGGFGWVKLPARDTLEKYWQGVITAPTRELFVARLDGTICGSSQLVLPPKNNEAQGHAVTLTTNFIAPWARGHELEKSLLNEVEKHSHSHGYAVINLDVRETMVEAIKLYESLNYIEYGLHPYSVRLNGETVKSKHYYKVINPNFFE